MAPTVCLAEFPMAGSTVNTYVYRRRRTRNSTNDVKRQTLALERILRTETVNETSVTSSSNEDCLQKLDCTDTMPDCLLLNKRLSTNMNEDERRRLITTRKDLLSIIIRTITLVQRNHILQKRVNALRAETRKYLRSASNDPEKQYRRRRLLRAQLSSESETVVSSSTDRIDSTSSLGFTRSTGVSTVTLSNKRTSDKSDVSSRSGC